MGGNVKQATFLVNGEKVLWKEGEITGPEHLVKIILSENERLRGNRITCNSYQAAPPGNLKNPWCIQPLLEYVFGDENLSF
jgi:hypothetical protein